MSLVSVSSIAAASDDAPQLKIATVSIQDVLNQAASWKEARKTLEEETQKYKQGLMETQAEIETFLEDIKKKSSVWSDEVKKDKEREYQNMVRDLKLEEENAQFELQKLEKKLMEPILKELHVVLTDVGKKNGFTMILESSRQGLESQTGVMYTDDSLDISDLVREELEKRLTKK
jgi:outer membrane protein